jgi:hypothetical protein
MRSALATLSLMTVLLVTSGRLDAQETTVRFPVASADGIIFTFGIGDHSWIRPGLRGMVVDPREQDALVARFRILSVSRQVARAEVSGQTTAISSSHMALLDPPPVPWYEQRIFWIGAGAGALFGLLLGGL